MIENIVLGTIQGIAEWLPVSSEGLVVLVKTWFFQDNSTVIDLISNALFLHLGTFFAALIYFRKEVGDLLKTLVSYRQAELTNKKVLNFLIITTLVSGLLGLIFLKFAEQSTLDIEAFGPTVTFFVGILLLITAALQMSVPEGSNRKESDIKTRDSLILGIVQSFAALPGLSRSGLTVSALLLDKFDKETALRLSFLMSLPIVLAGNIVLNAKNISSIGLPEIAGLLSSFVFGYLTIGILLKLARKVNFGWFVAIFGLLSVAASFIG